MITTILINILFVLGTSSGTAILLSQEWFDNLLYKLRLNIKPLNCALCLTFWITLFYLLYKTHLIEIALPAAFINALIGEFLYRKINFM